MSIWKKHFYYNDHASATCLVVGCQAVVKRKDGNTTGMQKHLYKAHPDVYDFEIARKAAEEERINEIISRNKMHKPPVDDGSHFKEMLVKWMTSSNQPLSLLDDLDFKNLINAAKTYDGDLPTRDEIQDIGLIPKNVQITSKLPKKRSRVEIPAPVTHSSSTGL